MKTITTPFAVAALAALVVGATFTAGAEAAGHFRAHGGHRNAAGGYSGGTVAGARGPNGGGYLRGHRLTTDGNGNGTFKSGAAVRGPNGGEARRAGETTYGADGSVSHQSGFSASGSRGSVDSSGSASRTVDGAAFNRDTNATGANGNSYSGTTSYSKDTGLVHSGTCTDAAGNVIPCR